jgi:hypothetical protein
VVIVLALAIWFGFSAVVAIVASAKGRSGIAWFIMGVMISPLLSAVGLFLVPEREGGEQFERR